MRRLWSGKGGSPLLPNYRSRLSCKAMATAADLSPEITMRELLELYPGAQRALFQRYHIGGCSSCGFSPDETLGGVCARNDNLPFQEVAEHIRQSHEQDERMRIDPAELATRLSDGTTRVVDVRTREEWEAAQIEGSLLLTQELMQEILSRWDKEALLVLVDHHGTRSLDAAAYFAGHGFTDVKSLRGGIDAWSREIDPNVPRYHIE
jgi:rhodanese-related sulfurtransferase